jgi:A/G-specific adenine glycosylase
MPWRRTHDPYRILVSEIMLQQTGVDRVRGKYAEFLAQFPDVSLLAHAPLGAVLRVWSGLGYNRRARYLHECAKKVVHEHGGKFPATFEELIKLPGIGMSTAGALLAFSFGGDTPMIDTNIRRILVRVFFNKVLPSDKELYAFALSLIPKGKGKYRGRAWNYAMLDLGATLCTARNHSDACPLMKLHGKVGDFVYKKPQKKFAGSRRQTRGQILRLLTTHKVMTMGTIAQEIGKTKAQSSEIIKELVTERLVVVVRGNVRLP